MATDENVATAITALKARWGTIAANSRKFPGSVAMWVPVDSTSKAKIIVPGEVIYHLGFTADGVGAIDKIFESKSTASGTPLPAGHRGIGVRQLGVKYTPGALRAKKIVIPLNTPYTYSYKAGTRDLTKISMRFPSYVSIKGIIYFLWNHAATANRPAGFYTDKNVFYGLSNIAVADLGELTEKVEEAEADQAADTTSPVPETPLGTKKGAAAPTTP